MKINDDNLDSLKGMEDVAYDFAVSADLTAAFRSAATTLSGQRSERASYRSTASTDFEGYFSTLFTSNGTTQLTDLDEIVRNLRLVATKVDDVADKAREENRRRRAAREWAQRRADRSFFQEEWDKWFGGEKAPYDEIADDDQGPSELVEAAALGARETPEEAGGPSGGTSAARPRNLKDFAASSRGADDLLRSVPGGLEDHCASYASSCSWASLDASSVISGYRQ